ncbi:MAG: glucokinase [Burkholderiaceae bacterium]
MVAQTTRAARVLGDVGGTHTRFAWQDSDGAPLRDIVTLSTADYASLAEALAHYLHGLGRAAPPWCSIGIANPITGDHVEMTNGDWSFSISALKSRFGFSRLIVINDFTALALALLDLPRDELKQIGGGAPAVGAPIALIGPGTGLGVSGLLPGAEPGVWQPVHGEGGHVTLAAGNAREAAVIEVMRDRFKHVSAEHAVSGQGLEALHAALVQLAGAAAGQPPLPAPEISRRAMQGGDTLCSEALELFCSFLGNVAGNLALTLGARAGVYVGGGIVPRLGDAFTRSGFRASFENKGRFRSYLEPIPVFVIHAEVSPALLGAARAL